MFFDMPLSDLETYRPDTSCPADLDAFWARTLEENPFESDKIRKEQASLDLKDIDVYDVSFPGYGQTEIKAWFQTPRQVDPETPVIVEYVGYGGGRDLGEQNLTWVTFGHPVLRMDNRGQAAHWGSGGDTADSGGRSGPAHGGYLTRGVQHPDDFYYRRLYVDAHHAVEAVSSLTGVAGQKIVTLGGSQGAAMALTAAALNDKVQAVMADVPFMSNFPRAVGLTNAGPYAEVVKYLSVNRDRVDETFRTLSYFDVANIARKAMVPALFSVALMDEVAPPSTVYATRNWYGGPTTIEVYRFNGHEGGGAYQTRKQRAWLENLGLGLS